MAKIEQSSNSPNSKKNLAKVKVYSTPTCPWCHKAKEFLQELKVEFEDINVAENQEAAQAMVEKSGQRGVPVVEIDGEMIVGFNPEAIKKALKIEE